MTATPRGAQPETDDSQNPTSVSPATPTVEGESGSAAESAADSTYALGTSNGATADEASGGSRDVDPEPRGRRRGGGDQLGGSEVVGQLQDVIERLARQAAPLVRQATPVLREIAAKAAELAAVAAENAGPAARRAAELTQDLGTRVAARSREVASDLRRAEEGDSAPDTESTSNVNGTAGGAGRAGASEPSRPREGTQRPPSTPGL
jgi:hypothetical protein